MEYYERDYILSEFKRGLSEHIIGKKIDFENFTKLANLAKEFEPEFVENAMKTFKMSKSDG
jgi:hypothetical protein